MIDVDVLGWKEQAKWCEPFRYTYYGSRGVDIGIRVYGKLRILRALPDEVDERSSAHCVNLADQRGESCGCKKYVSVKI